MTAGQSRQWADGQTIQQHNRRLADATAMSAVFTMAENCWLLERCFLCVPSDRKPDREISSRGSFDVCLVVDGKAELAMASRIPVRCGPGDLCYVPPHEHYVWRALRSPACVAIFQFKVSGITPDGRSLYNTLVRAAESGAVRCRSSVLRRAGYEWWRDLTTDEDTPLWHERMKARLHLLLATFLAEAAGSRIRESRSVLPDRERSDGFVRSEGIAAYVRGHLHRPIRIEDLAQHFRCSTRQVGRLFRAGQGASIGRYIVERKMQEAQRLLVSTADPVKCIAAQLGYTDTGYFCRVFRLYFGLSPGRLRKRLAPGVECPVSGCGQTVDLGSG